MNLRGKHLLLKLTRESERIRNQGQIKINHKARELILNLRILMRKAMTMETIS